MDRVRVLALMEKPAIHFRLLRGATEEYDFKYPLLVSGLDLNGEEDILKSLLEILVCSSLSLIECMY